MFTLQDVTSVTVSSVYSLLVGSVRLPIISVLVTEIASLPIEVRIEGIAPPPTGASLKLFIHTVLGILLTLLF